MKKEKSLLEKVQELQASKKLSTQKKDEEEELALAWVRDEVSLADCCKVLGIKTNNYGVLYYKFAHALKGHLNKTEADI